MNAAASSWCTRKNRTCSRCRRRPSMIPLMPSPGRPKTVSTPHSASRSISDSDAILAIRTLLYGCNGICGAGPPARLPDSGAEPGPVAQPGTVVQEGRRVHGPEIGEPGVEAAGDAGRLQQREGAGGVADELAVRERVGDEVPGGRVIRHPGGGCLAEQQ